MFILIGIYVVWMMPLGENLWHLTTSNGFVLPRESSVWTFQTLEMNEGSGEWWVRGRDLNAYYHVMMDGKSGYVRITAEEARNCKGFSPEDVTTWCLAE